MELLLLDCVMLYLTNIGCGVLLRFILRTLIHAWFHKFRAIFVFQKALCLHQEHNNMCSRNYVLFVIVLNIILSCSLSSTKVSVKHFFPIQWNLEYKDVLTIVITTYVRYFCRNNLKSFYIALTVTKLILFFFGFFSFS